MKIIVNEYKNHATPWTLDLAIAVDVVVIVCGM